MKNKEENGWWKVKTKGLKGEKEGINERVE